jgi:hypothetical protein
MTLPARQQTNVSGSGGIPGTSKSKRRFLAYQIDRFERDLLEHDAGLIVPHHVLVHARPFNQLLAGFATGCDAGIIGGTALLSGTAGWLVLEASKIVANSEVN